MSSGDKIMINEESFEMEGSDGAGSGAVAAPNRQRQQIREIYGSNSKHKHSGSLKSLKSSSAYHPSRKKLSNKLAEETHFTSNVVGVISRK